MKKLIISTICLFLFGFNSVSQAQNNPVFGFDRRGLFSTQDETKDYVVFEIPDMSAAQIKGAIYTKLSTMYASPKDVITNISDNIIQLEGYASRVYNSTTESASYPIDFSFTIIIQIKDGKVRYNIPTITQIYMQNVPFLGTARLDMTKPLSTLIKEDDHRRLVANYFNNLVDKLNDSISEEDDW